MDESQRSCVQLQQTARRAEKRALASPITATSQALLPSSMASLKEELAAAHDHAQALQQRIDEMLVQQSAQRAQHDAAEAALQQRIEELGAEAEAQRAQHKQQEASLLACIDELGAETEAQRAQHNAIQAVLQQRINELGAETEAQRAQHKQQEASLLARIDELGAEITTQRADHHAAVADLQHLLQAAQSNTTQELADAHAQSAALQAQLASEKAAALAAHNVHAEQLQTLEDRVTTAVEQAAAAEARMRETNSQLADAHARVEMLVQQHAAHATQSVDDAALQRLQALAAMAAHVLQRNSNGSDQWCIAAQHAQQQPGGHAASQANGAVPSSGSLACIEQLESCMHAMKAKINSQPTGMEVCAALHIKNTC